METQEILHKYNLKQTGCREGILSLLLEAGQALSENEIKEALDKKYDRTTFYRSFKTLLEHKIIHKIVVDNLLVKYAPDITVTGKQNHAHFYCERCASVLCVDSVPIEQPQLPNGYKVLETEMIIKGVCNNCTLSEKKR